MSSRAADSEALSASDRLPPSRLRVVAEAVLLALVAFAPWPFASVEPIWEFVLTAGVAVLVLLWAISSALTGRWAVRPDSPAGCLAGLILLAVIQLVPLPEGFVGVVSPTAVELHHALRPDQSEVLPGETAPGVLRPTFLPLSLDPAATRVFVARVLAVFLLYAVVRNWLASRDSFRRLAWVAAANGAALAAVGLAQFFSSAQHVVFWSVETGGQVFGPFVCRNHYPDYVNFCLGLGLGLLLRPAPRGDDPAPDEGRSAKLFDAFARVFQSPALFGLALLLGLTAASIPFSLSRGGLLGTVAAAALTMALAARVTGKLTAGGGAAAGVLALAVGLAAWFGWGPVEERFRTIWRGQAVDSRLPLWQDALSLCPTFLAAGSGGGSFGRVEPLARTEQSATVAYDNAHNEYLEALLEGGLIRLLLTLGLVAAVLAKAAKAYARLRGRATGPLALGAFFGLAALAVHSFADFGIHIPAVAVIATVVAAYASAAADDAGYTVVRIRRRRSDSVKDLHKRGDDPDDEGLALRGARLYAVAVGMVLLAGLMAWWSYLRARADQLAQASVAMARSTDPARLEARIGITAARAALAPDDPEALHDLGLAHFEAAAHAGRVTGAALAGGSAGFVGLPDVLPRGAAAHHIAEGLTACRAARAAGMLTAAPHVRLGQYVTFFIASEPAVVHFERAKRLRSADAAVWFAIGAEAFRKQDYAAAKTNWQRAMELSPMVIAAVLREAATVPDAMPLEDLIPSDPSTVLATADALYPDRIGQSDRRNAILQKAAGVDPQSLRLTDLYSLAAVLDELGKPEKAVEVWKAAITRWPNEPEPRDRYARWLELNERYDEAREQLEWLIERKPKDQVLRDRLDAALHGRRLKEEIEKK